MNGSAEAAILSQMLVRPGATWDVTKLNWLAKLASAPKLWFVGKDARYQSIAAALQADPLTWSATGLATISASPGDDLVCARLKSKIVTGYRGFRRHVARRHPQRSRFRATVGGFGAANTSIRSSRCGVGAKRWAICPMCDLARRPRRLPADKTWIVTLREQIGEAQRAMVAAPDVPADRVDYLRGVFAEVFDRSRCDRRGRQDNREIEYMSAWI